MQRYTQNRHAFSLVELMFVLAIMAILSTVATLSLMGAANKAKVTKTNTHMETIGGALKLYHVKYNAYPPSSLGIQALVNEGSIDYVLKDGWEQDFSYTSPTVSDPFGYLIQSAGKDGQWNTQDDILFDRDAQQ